MKMQIISHLIYHRVSLKCPFPHVTMSTSAKDYVNSTQCFFITVWCMQSYERLSEAVGAHKLAWNGSDDKGFRIRQLWIWAITFVIQWQLSSEGSWSQLQDEEKKCRAMCRTILFLPGIHHLLFLFVWYMARSCQIKQWFPSNLKRHWPARTQSVVFVWKVNTTHNRKWWLSVQQCQRKHWRISI